MVAHRGASWDEPENTIRAFVRAIEAGADYVELDVQPTLDGELVVLHDSVRATVEIRMPRLTAPRASSTTTSTATSGVPADWMPRPIENSPAAGRQQ